MEGLYWEDFMPLPGYRWRMTQSDQNKTPEEIREEARKLLEKIREEKNKGKNEQEN